MSRQSEILRILLIEDSPVDAFMIRELLKEVKDSPFDLKCADRLSTGLERLGEGGIDVVLLDLVLPAKEGTELLLEMKARPELRGIPVVAVSGVAVGKARQQVLTSLSVPLLGKPWDKAELLDRIEDAFLGPVAFVR